MASAKFIAKPELKVRREALGSQEEMVSLINVETHKNFGRTFYGNIETGARPATADMALTIARILKSDVAELFISNDAKEDGKDNG